MVKKAHTPTPDSAPPADVAALLDKIKPADDPVVYTLRCVHAVHPGLANILPVIKQHVATQFDLPLRTREIAARNHAIRQDHQRGERPCLLARRYKLSEVQIWRIVNNVQNH